MSQILFLEDDPNLGEAIRLQLELEGFHVAWAKSVTQAKEMIEKGHFDLFVLDVNLPDGTGFDVCRYLRDRQILNPVIFLTARVDEESVVQGFSLGASDYIRKPFGKLELLARIKNQMADQKPQDVLRYCDLVLLKSQQALKFNADMISLNRREFEILLAFFERPESILSREALMQKLSSGDEIFDRTIDSHVSHIRAKLRKHGVESYRIASVYGSGYRFEKVE